MVSGPPTIATAIALMPISAHTTGDRAWVATRDSRSPNSVPVSTPRNREAKNSPPRKPEPMDTAEATDFARISSAMWVAE